MAFLTCQMHSNRSPSAGSCMASATGNSSHGTRLLAGQSSILRSAVASFPASMVYSAPSFLLLLLTQSEQYLSLHYCGFACTQSHLKNIKKQLIHQNGSLRGTASCSELLQTATNTEKAAFSETRSRPSRRFD